MREDSYRAINATLDAAVHAQAAALRVALIARIKHNASTPKWMQQINDILEKSTGKNNQ